MLAAHEADMVTLFANDKVRRVNHDLSVERVRRC
jgi:hypothetical protein